jgi:hypothetical protein
MICIHIFNVYLQSAICCCVELIRYVSDASLKYSKGASKRARLFQVAEDRDFLLNFGMCTCCSPGFVGSVVVFLLFYSMGDRQPSRGRRGLKRLGIFSALLPR